MRPLANRRDIAYLLAVAACIGTAVLALPLRDLLDVANIDMLFLLVVFMVAIRLGRGPAIMAAFLSVALFDFFFVPPYLSFAVADAQYLVTFAVMLAVGLVTSHLVVRLAERTAQANARERETRVLYELSQALATTLGESDVARCLGEFLNRLELESSLLIVTASTPEIQFTQLDGRRLTGLELGFARSACANRSVIETDSLAGMGVAVLFLPLRAPERVAGLLAIATRTIDVEALREQRPLLEAVASLVAMILERIRYARSAQQSELDAASERLRTTILSSLSHDLRTPLTSLVGLADSLAGGGQRAAEDARDIAANIRDQAHAMHHLLSNLLEMARLKAGHVTLNKVWQPFDEVIGSSIRVLANLLADRPVKVVAPRGLPLVEFDAVLLERVVCNLLENAVKYSASATPLEIRLAVTDGQLEVQVCNQGKGFPPDRIGEVFELFIRGERETTVPGTGMGLSICKAIIEAHGGTIVAENRPDGACVRFTLPLGTPPAIVEEQNP